MIIISCIAYFVRLDECVLKGGEGAYLRDVLIRGGTYWRGGFFLKVGTERHQKLWFFDFFSFSILLFQKGMDIVLFENMLSIFHCIQFMFLIMNVSSVLFQLGPSFVSTCENLTIYLSNWIGTVLNNIWFHFYCIFVVPDGLLNLSQSWKSAAISWNVLEKSYTTKK